MSLAVITLPTNKSISTVSDHVRKIGQGEKGQTLQVIVTDAEGAGYNLDGKSITFSENKEGGKIVSDNATNHFKIDDAQGGRFTYTLAPAVYAASGTAWFDITSADGSVIDTTKNFNIEVIEDEGIHINNDNYVSNLVAFETHYDAVIKKSKEDSEALLTKINGQLSQALTTNNKNANDALTANNKNASDALAKAQSDLQKVIDAGNDLQKSWNDQFTKQKQALSDVDASWQVQTKKIQDTADGQIASIKSDAETQKQAIQSAADDQLKTNKNANDAEIADVKKQLADELAKVEADKTTAIKAVADARDKAIQDATDKLTVKLQSVQDDYNKWKTSTVSDFQDKLDKLTQQLKTDEDDQASLKQAIDSAKEAVSKIKDVDFTVYVHKDDLKNYYTKAELDPKLAEAGKVKTVNNVEPDDKGNITIPAPDLSGLETKVDAKTDHDNLDKKITDNATAIKGNSDAIATKANAKDVYTKAETDTAIATKANAKDVYTKAETDTAIANGGKVKTVNGVKPDEKTGDVAIDLSGYETKADAKTALDSKADKTALDSKAEKADVTTLQTTVTGLSTKVDTVVTKLSDGTLAQVAHFKSSEVQKALDWSKDDGKGGLPKFGIIGD